MVRNRKGDADSYQTLVEKMEQSRARRSSREVEVEQALNASMPGLLRRLLDETDGSKNPALRKLNRRLDDAGKEANVSPNTFYDWLAKYQLDG